MIERMTLSEATNIMNCRRERHPDIGDRWCASTLRNQYLKIGNLFSYCEVVEHGEDYLIRVKQVQLI